MIRSVAAVVIPILLWGMLWVGGNAALATALPQSFDENRVGTSPGLLAATIAFSMTLSLLAGFLCARIAGRGRPVMRLVSILAAIQFLIGVFVQAGAWDLMPLWYHLVFLALVIPGHLAGGWLGRQSAEAGPITMRQKSSDDAVTGVA